MARAGSCLRTQATSADAAGSKNTSSLKKDENIRGSGHLPGGSRNDFSREANRQENTPERKPRRIPSEAHPRAHCADRSALAEVYPDVRRYYTLTLCKTPCKNFPEV